MEIKTSCKGCVFVFKGDGGTQTGCKIGRSKKLNPDNDTVDGYFEFNRFCNTYRPQEWLDLYYDSDIDNGANHVFEEVVPRISYIINFNEDICCLESIVQSVTIRQSINNIGVIIVVNDKVEYNEDIMRVLNQYNEKKRNILVQTLENMGELKKFDTAFKHAKNGWSVFLPMGQQVGVDFVSRIHQRVNIDMKRFSYCKDEATGRFVVQSSLYKLLEGNSVAEFDEKITFMKNNDPDCIPSWGEMFSE